MSAETVAVVSLLALVTMATSFWYARRVDRQQAQGSDLMSRSAALQDRQQAQNADLLSRTAALQAREAELLARWEALVGRLEQFADRLEQGGRA
jgi:Tfp pilus assembly protein PilE